MADELDKLNALSAPLGQGKKASEMLSTTPPPGLARQGTTASQDLEALSGTESPTPGSKLYEMGMGTMQGAARDTPVMAGAMTGFRLGMPAAAAAAPAWLPAQHNPR